MKRLVVIAAALMPLIFPVTGNTAIVDFTGGTVRLYNGTDVVLNNSAAYIDQVSYYTEGSFRFDFGSQLGSSGTYYNQVLLNRGITPTSTPNDVLHMHFWLPLGSNVNSMTITKIGGGTFDFTYFDITTNAIEGGGTASGAERTYITNNLGYSGLLPSSNWGFDQAIYGAGDGVTGVWLSSNFLGVSSITFMSENTSCFGVDNFYFNESPPPNPVPLPPSVLLFGSGLIGLSLTLKLSKSNKGHA